MSGMSFSPGKTISDGKFVIRHDEGDSWEVIFVKESWGETYATSICVASRDKCAEIAVMMNGIIGVA